MRTLLLPTNNIFTGLSLAFDMNKASRTVMPRYDRIRVFPSFSLLGAPCLIPQTVETREGTPCLLFQLEKDIWDGFGNLNVLIRIPTYLLSSENPPGETSKPNCSTP